MVDFKNPESMIAEAERLGKEAEELEERNKKRRAKGRKPLPDAQTRLDMEVRRRKPRSGAVTVDAADALKLYEIRKSEMQDSDIEDDEEEELVSQVKVLKPVKPVKAVNKKAAAAPKADSDMDEEKAVREAAAVRRVQDMKNGRVDHEGNWSEKGQQLEGGDMTVLVDKEQLGSLWAKGSSEGLPEASEPLPAVPMPGDPATERPPVNVPQQMFEDLYRRLGTSFQALERTLSDLQGRVAEIVTASVPSAPPAEEEQDVESEFKAMLRNRTPVTFDIGGTEMTFDAICVFGDSPPCITVVSRIDSAKIAPKPGTQLHLTYEMNGEKYVHDPVTYLGTKFDLPMFGLSFVGFIRDAQADLIDVAAGIGPAGS